MTDDRLTAALDEIRARAYGPQGGFRDLPDTRNLLAALDRVLELTDPLQNPTLGGMLLASLHLQVRRAVAAELLGKERASADGDLR